MGGTRELRVYAPKVRRSRRRDEGGRPFKSASAAIPMLVRLEPRLLLAVSAGGPYTISEGSSLKLTGTGQADTVDYSWDINGDAVFGDATGAAPTLTWEQLKSMGINDGLSTWNMTLRCADAVGVTTDSPVVTLKVNDTKPTLTVTGGSIINEGSPYMLNLSASDPGNDTISNWSIDWGDGSAVENFPGTASSAEHVYVDGGIRPVVVRATNEDGTFTAPRFGGNMTGGSLDTTFGSNGIMIDDAGGGASWPRGVVVQPDGKIVVAGTAGIGSNNAFAVTRYNPDGSLDLSFDGDGRVLTDFGSGDDQAFGVALQTDGKIVVVGMASNATETDFAVARYNIDGSLDSTFDSDGKLTTSIGAYGDGAYSVAIQSDGKIVVGGYTKNSGGSAYTAAVRFNTNGSLDTTFGGSGKVLPGKGSAAYSALIQPDGKIVLAGSAVFRLNIDGTLDASFSATDQAVITYSIALQADGKIVAAGYNISGYDSFFRIRRYNPDGQLDSTFDGDGVVTLDGFYLAKATGLALQPDGKIIAVGTDEFSSSATYSLLISRFNSDGSLDPTFSKDGKLATDTHFWKDYASIALQPDGNLVIVERSTYGSFEIRRYGADGSPDGTFAIAGEQVTYVGSGSDRIYALAAQPDGQIISGGTGWSGATNDFAVHRYTASGQRDGTFDQHLPDGYAIVNGLALQPDGSVLAAGYAGRPTDLPSLKVNRLTTTGTLESNAFIASQIAPLAGRGVAVLPDGKFVVAGHYRWDLFIGDYFFTVTRFNQDFTIDFSVSSNSFSPYLGISFPGASSGSASSVVTLPDGRFVAGGSAGGTSTSDFALARIRTDGKIDTSFNGTGKVLTDFAGGFDVIRSMVLQPDGKIVAVGYSNNGSRYDFALARYNTDGSLDTSFDGDGKATTSFGNGDDQGYGVVLQPDGRIVVGGYAIIDGKAQFALARYLPDGSLDLTFDEDGKATIDIGPGNDYGQAIVLQPDGQIVIGGYSSNGLNDDSTLVRYNAGDFAVIVRNVAPAVSLGPDLSAQSNRPITLTAAVTDPGALDTFTYQWKRNGIDIAGATLPTYSFTTASSDDGAVYSVVVTDKDGASSTDDLVLSIDDVKPTSGGGTFIYGGAAQKVSASFSEDVSASLSPGDVSAAPLEGGGAAIHPASVAWDAATRTATFAFGSALADGNYRATILAGDVADAAGNPLSADIVMDFFVLRGDANRDRTVNFADLVKVSQNYKKTGMTWDDGDLNGDGKVDFADLVAVSQQYKKSVPPPVSQQSVGQAQTPAPTLAMESAPAQDTGEAAGDSANPGAMAGDVSQAPGAPSPLAGAQQPQATIAATPSVEQQPAAMLPVALVAETAAPAPQIKPPAPEPVSAPVEPTASAAAMTAVNGARPQTMMNHAVGARPQAGTSQAFATRGRALRAPAGDLAGGKAGGNVAGKLRGRQSAAGRSAGAVATPGAARPAGSLFSKMPVRRLDEVFA